jgi:hypothetical protein
VGLLKPYERAESKTEPEAAAAKGGVGAAQTKDETGKKQVPTPSRKQAEQARRDRLHPNLTRKEIRSRERQVRTKERQQSFERQENAPAKVLMRDFVDSRRSLSQWAMPIILTMLAVEMGAMYSGVPTAAAYFTYGVWAVMLAILVDLILLSTSFRKLAAKRIPDESLRGVIMYGVSRAINIRRFRQPAPRVKPGDKF